MEVPDLECEDDDSCRQRSGLCRPLENRGKTYRHGRHFPSGPGGWLLLPAKLLAHFLNPDKPVSEQFQGKLEQL